MPRLPIGRFPAIGQSKKPEMVASEPNKIERKARFGPDQAWRGWQRQNATAKIELRRLARGLAGSGA